MARRSRVTATLVCAVLVTVLAACGSSTQSPAPKLPTIIGSMSASDFHQIGVGVGAQPLTGTVASALNASPADVQSYYDTICSGQPALILPRLLKSLSRSLISFFSAWGSARCSA